MKTNHFEIDEWIQRLDYDIGSYYPTQGFAITSPGDIVRLECLRREIGRRYSLGQSVPTDVFIFGKGNPARRDATKVGGVPYRPADVPWPTSGDGTPMTFLAQYCFADSRDIIGDTPGDILLVFTKGKRHFTDSPQDHMHFEWHSQGVENLLADDLVVTARGSWKFVHCYGSRCRTVDYFKAMPANVFKELVPGEVLGTYHVELARTEFARIRGMKIGGLPLEDPWDEEESPFANYRYLCALGTIFPAMDVPYPWTNDPNPIGFRSLSLEKMTLDLRDGFLMDFYLDPQDDVKWTIRFF